MNILVLYNFSTRFVPIFESISYWLFLSRDLFLLFFSPEFRCSINQSSFLRCLIHWIIAERESSQIEFEDLIRKRIIKLRCFFFVRAFFLLLLFYSCNRSIRNHKLISRMMMVMKSKVKRISIQLLLLWINVKLH